MRVLGVDHAAIKTWKLEQTRAFFVEVLGLKVGPRPAFAARGYWLYASNKDVVHLIETEAPKAPSAVAAIHHVALRIADFDAALAHLTARGVPFEIDETPGGELRQCCLTDPNGVRIELNAPGAAAP